MRIVRAASLVALLLIATACELDVSMRTTVAKDGSGSFSMVVSVDQEFSDLAGAAKLDPFASLAPSSLDQKGFTVTRAPRSVTIARRFRRPDDLGRVLTDLTTASPALSSLHITLSRNVSGGRTTTTFDATYDLSVDTLLAKAEMSSPDKQRLQTILEQPSGSATLIELVLVMPGELHIQSRIPTEEAGGVLTWRPRLGSRGTIRVTSVVSNSSASLPVILGPILGAAALAAGLLATRRRRRTG